MILDKKEKQDPLYKTIAYSVIGIGVGISVLGFVIAGTIGLGYVVAYLVGFMDYATMQAETSRLADKYDWVFGIMMSAWWPGIFIGFLIDAIGSRLSRILASS